MSGIIPALHYTLVEGLDLAITKASLGWLILMGCLYVMGAFFYAVRVPERWFPGKCDLWVSILTKVFFFTLKREEELH